MKNGIKYFPFSSSLEQKYKFIKARFGLKGLAIVVLVLQQIYGDEGYYCEWSQDVALLFADENSVGHNVVSEVIEEALRRGIFDKELYAEYGVLSSLEIQENFFEATRRRKSLKIKKEYLLLDYTQIPENVDISLENDDIFSENDDIFEQRRGEEKRGDETKGEERRIPPADGTAAPSSKKRTSPKQVAELYNKICTSLSPVQSLTPSREAAIRDISQTIKKCGGFEKLFKTVQASDFLCGKNKLKWKCTFDWIINKDNAVKIMEGNFNNSKVSDYGSFDTDDFFEAALMRSYGGK